MAYKHIHNGRTLVLYIHCLPCVIIDIKQLWLHIFPICVHSIHHVQFGGCNKSSPSKRMGPMRAAPSAHGIREGSSSVDIAWLFLSRKRWDLRFSVPTIWGIFLRAVESKKLSLLFIFTLPIWGFSHKPTPSMLMQTKETASVCGTFQSRGFQHKSLKCKWS